MSQEIFALLVKSLPDISQNDKSSNSNVAGSLDTFDSTINLINSIANKNPSFLNMDIDGRTVESYLLPCALEYVTDEYTDYCHDNDCTLTVEEYVNIVWLTDTDNTPDNYYYSNGAYDMWGITGIILKTLINKARET